MTRLSAAVGAAILLHVPLVPLSAQGTSDSTGIISGWVIDTSRHVPLERAWACARRRPSPGPVIMAFCDRPDTSGAFALPRLAVGRYVVYFSCYTDQGSSITLDSAVVDVVARTNLEATYRTHTSGCDPRPEVIMRGMFRGHYGSGFELSEFTPCPNTAWPSTQDTLSRRDERFTRAWVEFTPRAQQSTVWPRQRVRRDQVRYYVEWQGMLLGPGHYGHLSSSVYELHVDSVLKVREARRDDCRNRRRG